MSHSKSITRRDLASQKDKASVIDSVTRRDFIKGAGCAAVGLAIGMPAIAEDIAEATTVEKSKVVLVRHPEAVGADGKVNARIIQQMLDQAMTTLYGKDDPVACWKQIIKPDDIVGIKTNVWDYLPTTTQVEGAIKRRVMDAGVDEKSISIDDRGVLRNPVFKKATALINARPLRSHAWSGAGTLIKNYIMFSPSPPDYHDDSCASLGALWELPNVKGKTRLNVLVMLTPLFHGQGWHHFDAKFTWRYNGLLVGTDPVALDSVGLRIFDAKRKEYFGEERPMKPPAHHVRLADTRYHVGSSHPDRIELTKLGWDEGVLI